MSEFISKDGTEYHCWFDNMAEMHKELPAMQNRCNSGAWKTKLVSSGYRLSANWFGRGVVDGYEVLRRVEHGSNEMLQEMAGRASQLQRSLSLGSVEALQVEVRRRKRQRGDYGDALDMHRVWGGQLDTAWERPVKVRRLTATERYATIFMDLGILSDVDLEDTYWRGAAGMCMIDALTKMGISTELWVGASGHDTYTYGPRNRWSGLRIKEFTQPLSEERLAVATHGMFHRTYGFGMHLAAPFVATPGMGSPSHSGFVKPLRERLEAGERVFRVGTCLSEWQAKDEVERVVQELKHKEAA